MPCIVVQLISIVYRCIFYSEDIKILIHDTIIKLIYASAYESDKVYLGVLWFLVVMFWSKILFQVILSYFPEQHLMSVFSFIALAGYFISRRYHLIQSMDIVFVAMFFLYIGYCLKNAEEFCKAHESAVILISFSFWTICWYNHIFIEMGIGNYPYFMICILEAICGCLCVFSLSKAIEATFLKRMLVPVGKHTLLILCVHCLDGFIENLWMNERIWIMCMSRIIIDVLIVFAIITIREKIRVRKLL